MKRYMELMDVRKMTVVEDHGGVANNATETYALPHAEQF